MNKYLWFFYFLALVCLVFYVFFKLKIKKGRFSPFTDNFLRQPGETLRLRLEDLRIDLMSSMILATLVPTVGLWSATKSEDYVFVLLFILCSLIFIWYISKALRISNEAIKLRLGLEGERATGQELDQLMRNGAWVFHDLPYKYGNIDHIVVLNTGIFAVETKAVSKPKTDERKHGESKVQFNGSALTFPHFTDQSSLEQARRHAKYLHKNLNDKLDLDVAVTPVVALPGWYVERTGKLDVLVLNPKERSGFLKFLPQRELSQSELKRISAHLDSVARSVIPGSRKLDPNSAEKYDFWMKPKYGPPSIE